MLPLSTVSAWAAKVALSPVQHPIGSSPSRERVDVVRWRNG